MDSQNNVCHGRATARFPPVHEGIYVLLDLGLLVTRGPLSEALWSTRAGAGQQVHGQH